MGNYRYYFAIGVLLIGFIIAVKPLDLWSTSIYTVTNETRYIALHPTANLIPFVKINHVKGNAIFSAGERIEGDRLILTHMDDTQYTNEQDIEVVLKYPLLGYNNYTITFVQIYVDLTSDDTAAYFLNGGITLPHCEILLSCNQTYIYGYQIYLYGY